MDTTTTATSYISLENLKVCESAFHVYMQERYGRTIESSEVLAVRRMIYSIMTEVEGRHPSGSSKLGVREKNNIALNIARDMVLNGNLSSSSGSAADQNKDVGKTSSSSSTPPQAPFIKREMDLYGNRTPIDMVSVQSSIHPPNPQNSQMRKDGGNDITAEFERAMAAFDPPAPPPPPPPGKIENTMDAHDFEMKVKELVQARATNHDENMAAGSGLAIIPFDAEHTNVTNDLSSSTYIQKPPPAAIQLEKHSHIRMIAIHGADRDVESYPLRFKFVVRVAGFSTNHLKNEYKNISWMAATCLVVPMEIAMGGDRPSGTRPFIHEYDFAYPYLVMNIDGMDGGYDGCNDTLRQCFSVMIFDRSYRAPNGRGYVVLKSAGGPDEKRKFKTPIGNLHTIDMSIARPNGTLLNNSVDNIKIVSISYETGTPLLVRVQCSRYFDRNEFYIGDVVRMSRFSSEDVEGQPNSLYLDQYVNREAGHEVVKIGEVNNQGFSNSFYILAPGMLNMADGSLVLDEKILDVIRHIGGSTTNISPGGIVNTSLQPFFTIKVGTLTE